MFASGKFSICRERFQSWDTVSPPSSLLGVEKTGRSRLPGADAGCHPGSSWASVTRPRGGTWTFGDARALGGNALKSPQKQRSWRWRPWPRTLPASTPGARGSRVSVALVTTPARDARSGSGARKRGSRWFDHGSPSPSPPNPETGVRSEPGPAVCRVTPREGQKPWTARPPAFSSGTMGLGS